MEIHLQGATEHAEIECHWAGRVVTQHAVIHPVCRFEQLANFDQLLARAVEQIGRVVPFPCAAAGVGSPER